MERNSTTLQQMFNDAQEIEDNLRACGKYVDQICNEDLKEEAYEPKSSGLDTEEHDQNQEHKFGFNMLERDDILSFDVSCFSNPKITQLDFASSENSFYKIDYVDNCPKDYATNDSDYLVSKKAFASKRLAVDTQSQ